MSIEIFDGPYAARLWADAHGDMLVEAAVTGGGLVDWESKRTAWGVVFEFCFTSETDWQRFRASDPLGKALQTAPDPHRGVLIYRGRSSDTGTTASRKPKRPNAGAGSMALEPFTPFTTVDPWAAFFSDEIVDRRSLSSTRN